MHATVIDVAPARPAAAIKGMAVIYALSALSCFLLNIVVHAAPIGPWSGAKLTEMSWLDNVTWQLLALWWALLSIVSGHYPFHRMADARLRGILTIGAAWALGWLSAKAIYWTGLGADWVFPIIGCIYFFLAFFSFTGENWIVAGFAPPRQFFILFVLIAFLTYAITNSAIRWIPAWWFPFVEMGSASTLLAYLTRGMTQPGRSFAQIGILFVVVMGALWLSGQLGLWDARLPGVGAFWTLGTYAGPAWLLWFMVACSVSYGFLIQLHNWPFTRIPMPWGGILACLFCVIAAWAITVAMLAMVGPVFADTNEALTYGYMGVHWSFLMAMLFGFGLDRPYLWRGQTNPGTWDDVE
ncbi:hypothetical protein [Sphingomonas sp.]|uniref:hypothetical protein n=1 Tax=Sphingomonas sp. TaxID=28214 RepID=UPI000DB6E955|nr:hypothetical protein [Sphingomonas sp.]PZU09923.1 MAG: hypothetical protein DI605_09475 [Sphingomonas sp.]